MFGIIGAMESEVTHLTAQLEQAKQISLAGIAFYTGTIHGTPVVVAQCGIGKVRAALCAQAMISRFAVTRLINTGVAGGLHPALAVGDLVIGTAAIQHDFDLTAFGYVKGYLGPLGDSQRPTRFLADTALITAFKTAADKILTHQKYLEGTIVSGDVFVSDRSLKHRLAAEFDAAAAEMEGAAIAQVAVANQVPFIIIRAISDLADGTAAVTFETFEKEAAKTSAAIVCAML